MSIDRAAESTTSASPLPSSLHGESDAGKPGIASDATRARTTSLRQRLRLAALTIGFLSLAVRASVLRDAFFITDDYMLSARAVENQLTFDYLTRVHTGHFEPIGFLVMWLHANYTPYSWGWASVFILGGQVLLLVVFWQLLVELFGRRLLILVPFSLLAFSSLTIAAFTWLSAAIIWLPLMIALAGLLRFHVRYVRDGRRRDAVFAFAWLIGGFAAFEKILLVLPFLAVFTLALENSYRERPLALLDILRRQWLVWTGYAVLAVAYIGMYFRGSQSAGATAAITAPSGSDLGDFVILSLGRTFIPGLFGGPWSWSMHSYGLALVDSPRLFDWICWALFIVIVIGSITLRRSIAWYWASLALYIALSLAIIAVGRVPYMGTAFALETRYLADAVIPLIVVISVCLMPLVGETEPLTADGQRWLTRPERVYWLPLAAATSVIVVLSLNSIAGYSAFSSNNPTRAFIANVRSSLGSLPPEAQVVDQDLPPNVLEPLWGEYNRTSRLLAPLVSPEMRDQMYTSTSFTDPYIVTVDGQIAPMRVEAAATSDPPAGWCFNNDEGTITIPLTHDTYDWVWMVRIGYLSKDDFAASVDMNGPPQEVSISRGLGEVYVTVRGSGDELRLTSLPRSAQLCIGDVQVGTAAPAAAP